MEIIEIQTLVDITNTNVRRNNQGTPQQLDQFRNWTTLLQCIGMRAILHYDNDPVVQTVDVKGMGFGSEYTGKHRVWKFQFRPDQAAAFADKNSATGLLEQDLDRVPVILNLTETINTKHAVFEINDKIFKNTVIKAL